MTLLSTAIAPFRHAWLRQRLNMYQEEMNSMHLGIANSKVPPAWTPEKDKQYPLRVWVQDIRLWSVSTDTEVARQGPVAAQRIGGTAKELIRELDMNVLVQGMALPDDQGNLIQHTGLECLIRALSRRYAPLAQEVEVHCIAEILQFRRAPGEDSDAVISRFELCRERALNGAGFDMSWVGFSFLLLCVLGIPKNQWALLLAPTQGSLPRDQAQYNAFMQYVRRQGHLTDRGVDGVKNMSFFTTGSETNPHDHDFAIAPMFAAWNTEQSWIPSQYDAVSAYTANASDTDDGLSSCNSGDSEADISDLYSKPYAVAGEQLYLAYRHHKRRWRKFTGGFKRRGKGKGGRKGKFGKSGKFGFGGGKTPGGKGKGKKGRMFFVDDYGQSSAAAAALYDETEDWTSSYYEHGEDWGTQYESEDTVVYLGKGKFKRKNPKGKDGKVLTCSGCGSEDHFIAKCPHNTAGITHAQAQAGSKTFVAVQNSGQASQSVSSGSSGWGSMIYVGSAREIQYDSTSQIEFSDGQILRLDASDELDAIPEEVDTSPTQPLLSTQTFRHYHIPNSAAGSNSQLSRSNSTQADIWARQFAFVWFMPAAFHAQVRLKDGVEALLVDVGAWDNLVGDSWVERASEQAKAAGQGCTWQKLKKMLSVEGVGQKANEASDEIVLPICLEDASTGTFQSAVIQQSELPALLGLKSLSKLKSLIDTHNKQLIFVGPGGYSLKLSPGSKVYKLHSAPTGHLMLPCQCWKGAKITPGKPGVAL